MHISSVTTFDFRQDIFPRKRSLIDNFSCLEISVTASSIIILHVRLIFVRHLSKKTQFDR